MKCGRCLGEILNPVEHEYCSYVPRITKKDPHFMLEVTLMHRFLDWAKSYYDLLPAEPLPRPYIAPKIQNKIIHESAPVGMRPPRIKPRPHHYYDDDRADATENARRLHEGLT